MKNLDTEQFNQMRVRHYSGHLGDARCGAFVVPYQAHILRVIAVSDAGWDHVSVSLELRIPNWEEMEYVKRLFFRDTEYAMQLHVPSASHINCHPNVLHLWRPHKQMIPRPPSWMV